MLRHLFLSIKSNLAYRDTFIHLAAALLLSLLMAGVYNFHFQISIDHSLRWLFNDSFARDPSTLASFIFPHGPLAFLQYPLPMANNYRIALLVQSAVQLAGIFFLLQHGRQQGVKLLVLLLSAILALSFQGAWYMAVIFPLLLSTHRYFYIYALFSALLVALGFYIRAYLGVSLCAVYGGIIVFQAVKHRKIWLLTLFYPLVFFILIWWILFSHITDVLTYVQGYGALLLGNSVAAALYPHNNTLLWLGAGLCGLYVFYQNIKHGRSVLAVGLALLLLITIKYAFARQDLGHLQVLYENYGLSLALMLPLLQKQLGRTVLFSMLGLLLFLASAKYANGINRFRHHTANPIQFLQYLKSPARAFQDYQAQWVDPLQTLALKPTDKELLQNHSTGIYPWNFLIAQKNDLNLSVQPIPHAYAAYKPYLDQQNQAFFNSAEAPEFLILHPASYHPLKDPLGVDDNYLWNAEPLTARAILKNYQPLQHRPAYSIFKKRSPTASKPLDTIGYQKVPWNQWVNIPPSAQSLWVAGTVKHSWEGAVKATLIKSAGTFIEYKLKNGPVRRYRLNPDNLVNGYLAQPLRDPLNHQNYKVEAIRLQTINPSDYQDSIALQWLQRTPTLGEESSTALRKAWSLSDSIPYLSLTIGQAKSITITLDSATRQANRIMLNFSSTAPARVRAQASFTLYNQYRKKHFKNLFFNALPGQALRVKHDYVELPLHAFAKEDPLTLRIKMYSSEKDFSIRDISLYYPLPNIKETALK